MTARVGRDFVFPVKFDRKRPAIRDRAVPSVCHRTDRSGHKMHLSDVRQNFAGVRIFKPKNEESFLLLGFSRPFHCWRPTHCKGCAADLA